MADSQNIKNTDKKKLRSFRVLIMDDASFYVLWRRRITANNARWLIALGLFLLLIFILALLLYTPIGYKLFNMDSRASVNAKVIEQQVCVDTLERELRVYAEDVKRLRAYFGVDSLPENYSVGDQKRLELDLPIIEGRDIEHVQRLSLGEDQLILSKTSMNDSDSVAVMAQNTKLPTFFSPIDEGFVTSIFEARSGHYAIDLACRDGANVYAVLSGIVVFSAFEPLAGHTVILQHEGGYMSVYKHCSRRMCQQGDYVLAGQLIGLIGNSGEITTGTHLHFELWRNARALDPANYITF